MRGPIQVLPSIPVEHHNKVARFLEAQGFKEEALEIATDPDYKFELAVQVTAECTSCSEIRFLHDRDDSTSI